MGVLAAAIHAQQQSAAAPDAETINKLTQEWYPLANTLEQRVTRMLPCDPRVRTEIEEVMRASSARTAALNSFWQARSAQSKAQIEALGKLQSFLTEDSAERRAALADAQQEQAAIAAMSADLATSAKSRPALNAALTSVQAMAEHSTSLATLTEDRETAAAALSQEIAGALEAAQTRQTAFEAEQKAAAAEAARWTAYYATRLTRAQTECAITSQTTPSAPPKPAAAKREP